MIYDIRHVTTYSYESPVSFARCTLRLEPSLRPAVPVRCGRLGSDTAAGLLVGSGDQVLVLDPLTGRIRELAERYAMPLPDITGEVVNLAARVEEHLKRMGALWK